MELEQLKRETQEILLDLLSKAHLRQGQILVLGLSTSEVAGASIGKNSSLEIGQAIVKTILDTLTPKGIYLAVQGCEYIPPVPCGPNRLLCPVKHRISICIFCTSIGNTPAV